MIPPGATIGILGGGQLGRMLAISAAKLGYRCHVFAAGLSGPASEVAVRWTRGNFADADAVARFAAQVDVVTCEIENVDIAALAGLPGVRPGVRAIEVAQDRLVEKAFAEEQGGTCAEYVPVNSLEELVAGIRRFGAPAILKTRRMGYDGKGQARLSGAAQAEGAWATIGGKPAVLERLVRFDAEFSVLLARGIEGETVRWRAVENVHVDGILASSRVPAERIAPAHLRAAVDLVERIAESLDYVGVLACEFFDTAEGPLFNEMAPRVHNSGHWTIEGAVTSQFENHIRAICGLPLGSTDLIGRGAEMRNLIGSDVERWPAIVADPTAHLHLYGKDTPRPGRKMGHVTHVVRG